MILNKENKEDTKKWKDTLCSWIKGINIVKMSILPKAISSRCNPYQNASGIFHKYRRKKKPLKFVWKHDIPQIAKVILRNKKQKILHFLISKHITKLQSSKQYSIGLKTERRTSGTE